MILRQPALCKFAILYFHDNIRHGPIFWLCGCGSPCGSVTSRYETSNVVPASLLLVLGCAIVGSFVWACNKRNHFIK
ncbi:hypothetical protein ACHAW5_006922 [Stephanodiscus triporus]|uniref:Uncharacterized protein n=1 Tax=Stephanodiscus triporus TaxID=2934178 RepID=A0ABD3NDF9_9STRA